jgi:streptogramin lyase
MNFKRAAGAFTGTYTETYATLTGTNNFTGSFILKNDFGSITYQRGAVNNMTFNCTEGASGYKLSGTTSFNVVSTESLSFNAFDLTRSDGKVLHALAGTLKRTNNNYIGLLTFSDGEPTTSSPDFLNWILVISDLNDSNSNSIPDLSDSVPTLIISTQPISITTNVNTAVTFSVTAIGTNTINYQWYFNGTPINGATSSSLTLNNVTTSNAGSYTVNLTNNGGNITSSAAVLTVIPLPTIITQPTSSQVLAYTPTTLTVTASGGNALAYQWYKDGVTIIGATSSSYLLNGQNSDNGSYTVIVTNSAGSITSNPALINVTAPSVIPYVFNSIKSLYLISSNGTATNLNLGKCNGIAINNSNTSYVLDYVRKYILCITQSGTIATRGLPGFGLPGFGSSPQRIAIDSNGNSYTTDNVDNVIRKIAVDGTVTIIAGNLGVIGANDGTGASATFNSPVGITIDSNGNLYVADYGNKLIRKIDTLYNVTTVAGIAGISGYTDGPINQATFTSPIGITIDTNYNIYVCESLSNTIRKITTAGIVSTYAGKSQSAGALDGVGVAARFNNPQDLTVDSFGNLYVADSGNYLIREIDTAANVKSIAGKSGVSGSIDGSGISAGFAFLTGISFNKTNGTLAVTEYNSASNISFVRLGIPAILTSITSQPKSLLVNPGSSATFAVNVTGQAPFTFQWFKNGVPIPGATSNAYSITSAQLTDAASYYVTITNSQDIETSSSAILSINSPPLITTQPISATATLGYPVMFSVNAIGGVNLQYQWYLNGKTITDATSNVYRIPSTTTSNVGLYTVSVSNQAGSSISSTANLVLNSPYVFTTIAGSAGLSGAIDAAGSLARFNRPTGICVDKNGNIFVSDTNNFAIRKITPSGFVSTYAGVLGMQGRQIGSTSVSNFYMPLGITLDATGNLYVIDENAVKKITNGGSVLIFAGNSQVLSMVSGSNQYINISGIYSITLNTPQAIALDNLGNYFVSAYTTLNSGFSGVYKLSNTGLGSLITPSLDAARLSGIVTDSLNNVYICVNNVIDKISSSGVLTVFAGSGSAGSLDGVGGAASFNSPTGLAVDSNDNLYVADSGNNLIRLITPSGVVTTIGGTSALNPGSSDGAGSNASFYNPIGIAVDSSGAIYVADNYNNTIRKGVIQTVAQVAPVIITQPSSQATFVGSAVTLSAAFSSSGNTTYQWYQNGIAIPGANSNNYTVNSAKSTDTGIYTLVATNSSGSVTTNPVAIAVTDIPKVTNSTQLVNVSCLQQLPKNGMLTTGFILQGTQSSQVLIRVSGPALANFGVPNVMTDPTLKLYDSNQNVVASNSGWAGNQNIATAANSVGAFAIQDTSSNDSAVLVNLQPGAYTVQGASASGQAGSLIIEVYQLPAN